MSSGQIAFILDRCDNQDEGNIVMPASVSRVRLQILTALFVAGLTAASCGGEIAPSTTPGLTQVQVTPSPRASTITDIATPTPVPSAVVSPTPAKLTAIVPVVNFWSPVQNITSEDIKALLSGATTKDFHKIVSANGLGQDLVNLLGLDVNTVPEMASDEILSSLKAGELGLIKIDDLTPQVSTLSVDGLSLLGTSRLTDFARWPLLINDPTTSFDYQTLWTLAAGGDVNLDRSIYRTTVTQKRGADYTWNGGTSVITGHVCCGTGKNLLVVGKATGSPGAFRAVFADSDIALVNLEGPAPNKYSYHPDGYTFTFDPALLAGLSDSGITAVGLANNHMRNAGSQGVIDTCNNLDRIGVAHAGAGINLAAARAPTWLSADGQRIAFLAYDAIQPANWATASRPGAAPLNITQVVSDIKAAKAAGADVVIVMPHWGKEYTAAVSSTQRHQAQAMVDAGADLILGSHSHWAGGISLAKSVNGEAFIDYSLGDLIFDLNNDERTQEAVIVDLTFSGSKLLAVKLRPTLFLNSSQGSLLTGAGAQKVLDDIRRASTF